MEKIEVRVPEYPYDVFEIELDREGSGAFWRENRRIARVSRTWAGWMVGDTYCPGTLTDEAITAAIDKAVAEGKNGADSGSSALELE